MKSSQWRRWDVQSNLAYPAAAVVGATLAQPVFTIEGALFVALMTTLCAASMYYHAGGIGGNHLDVGAMYATGLYLWIAGALDAWWWLAILVALPAAWWLRMRQLDVPMELKVGALFGVLYLTAIMFHPEAWRILAVAGTVFALALAVRPWLHSLWHVISAIGLAMLWVAMK